MSQFDVLAEVKSEPKQKPKQKPKPPQKIIPTPLSPTEKITKPQVGKSKDERFIQVGAYIKKQTYIEVKKALLDKLQKTDFSDLVEELLSRWLAEK